jgi:hypothetical protein
VSTTERPTLPVAADRDDSADPADVEVKPPDDGRLVGNFYSGLIVFLDRVRGRGTIRSWSGREIPFEFPFVSVIGAPLGGRLAGIQLIRQGDMVGFDVGWTSKGLRVTRIKPLG